MILELHIIQNFAPSCLNRDDLNTPKECEFGAVRRARISSQCLKRTIRTSIEFQNEVKGIGTRTKRLQDLLQENLIDCGQDSEKSSKVSRLVANSIGSGSKNGRTNVALYLGHDEIEGVTELILKNFEELASASEEIEENKGTRGKKVSSQAQKLADEIQKNFKPGTNAADIALFGRMIADATHFNVDAACQVAHAISTHRVAPEIDYFTAVDDLQPKEDPGAGMIGTQSFNSPCFYRFSCIHLPQLIQNLNGDQELAAAAVLGFVKASVTANPSAKQNSHAAHNPPDFVMTVVRSSGTPISLANAFVRPVNPRRDSDLVEASNLALARYWEAIIASYGAKGINSAAFFGLGEQPQQMSNVDRVKGLDNLISVVRQALENGNGVEAS